MHASEVYWKGQARAIREAAEAWKQDYAEAQSVLQFEASLDHPLATYEAISQLYRRIWDDLFSGRIARPIENGVILRDTFAQLAGAFEKLCEAVRSHRQKGYVIARGNDVEQAARDLRKWETDVAARWPGFDSSELKAVLGVAPPEFVDAEEIYREFPEVPRPDPA